MSGGGKTRFDFFGCSGVKRGKDQLGRGTIRRGGIHRHAGDLLRDRRVQVPLGGLTIFFARRTVRCGQPRNFKPRMPLEQLNEALPYSPGRAENSNWNFAVHEFFILAFSGSVNLTTDALMD